jgi:hypothetical protein
MQVIDYFHILLYRCIGWNKPTRYWGPCQDSSQILTTEAEVQCRAVHVGSVVDKVAGSGAGFALPLFQDWNYIVVATDSVGK